MECGWEHLLFRPYQGQLVISQRQRTLQDRVEKLLSLCYESTNRPIANIQDDLAFWMVSPGEIWGTGDSDRITRFVLGCHAYRLQGYFRPQDDKIRVSVELRGYAPDFPLEHHPGLSDLVARAYQFGGKSADSDLLARAREVIREILFTDGADDENHPAHAKAILFLQESNR